MKPKRAGKREKVREIESVDSGKENQAEKRMVKPGILTSNGSPD
ncbi:hypothetical protein [Allobaculum sp. JKK-2023]|nr:hypothetical protein [Allobaculum sp. JKK-2023]